MIDRRGRRNKKLNNRKSINLKRVRNYQSKKSSKKRSKDISTDCWSYNLANRAFDRKKYRLSYYSFKISQLVFMTIEVFLFSLIAVSLLEAFSLFATGKISNYKTGLVLVTLFWTILIEWLVHLMKDYFEETWTNRSNQLLAILEHDGEIYWHRLSENERNILREYVSEQATKMQKIKVGKMTYGDVLTIKSNLDYLQSIKYVNKMPGVYGLSTRVKLFEAFYTKNIF